MEGRAGEGDGVGQGWARETRKKNCEVRKKMYICMFGTKCAMRQMVLNNRLFHQLDTYD